MWSRGSEMMATAAPPSSSALVSDASELSSAPQAAAPSAAAAPSNALKPFVIISIAYLLFTVTDGAIRMIVLMHAYAQGFSAIEVAAMFSLYEVAGVVTNVGAGIAGAKWGIRWTLLTGLTLQLLSYGLLFFWDDSWSKLEAICFVTFAQVFAGVAKDLTKLGGKTVTKLVTPGEQSTRLFRLVSLLTGWKNSLKGVGYFAGSALVTINYELALGSMMALIVIAWPFAFFGLGKSLGTAKKKNATWADIFITSNTNLLWLSAARLFLFASRDFWFEVPLPFFLRSPACAELGNQCLTDADCTGGAYCANVTGYHASASAAAADDAISMHCANLNTGGGCGGVGWDRPITGMVLALYIIVYGQFQSWTPQLVTGPLRQTLPNKLTEVLWGLINCFPTAALAAAFFSFSGREPTRDEVAAWLLAMLVAFALIFAVNSSIHSFLVVHYAKEDKVATSVGFYYMSNACGRLFGTIGSGVLYSYVGQWEGDIAGRDARMGMAACLVAGTLSSVVAVLITAKIRDEQAGLRCGSCVCVEPLGARKSRRSSRDIHSKAPVEAVLRRSAAEFHSSVA